MQNLGKVEISLKEAHISLIEMCRVQEIRMLFLCLCL